MKKLIKLLFSWIFEEELTNLKAQIEFQKDKSVNLEITYRKIMNLLDNIDVSVDVHEGNHQHSKSWAVISIQGHKTDFIKFVDLSMTDIHQISQFLRMFERDSNIKVDASPQASQFLKINRRKGF